MSTSRPVPSDRSNRHQIEARNGDPGASRTRDPSFGGDTENGESLQSYIGIPKSRSGRVVQWGDTQCHRVRTRIPLRSQAMRAHDSRRGDQFADPSPERCPGLILAGSYSSMPAPLSARDPTQALAEVYNILYTQYMKQVLWRGDSRDEIRKFPEGARKEAGRQLMRVQSGLDPTDWKPMRTVGPGVREIRIRYRGQYRIIYVATRGGVIVVLHAFEKKTQRTSRRDITLARKRFKELD